MKINSPEDIVSAYATMRLLEPICGDGYSLVLSVYDESVDLSLTDDGSDDIVASTCDDDSVFLFREWSHGGPKELIDKLNAAMAPERNENQ